MKETSKTKVNPNGEAIVNALADRKGEVFAFAEIAHMAGVEAKTGFLTAAKKIASDRNLTLQKVREGVTVAVTTYTHFPSEFQTKTVKFVTVDGYRLVDGKDQPKEVAAEVKPEEVDAE